jgi:hypothetical protein
VYVSIEKVYNSVVAYLDVDDVVSGIFTRYGYG